MIKNEKQYRITKASIKDFEQTLAGFKKDSALPGASNKKLHPALVKAQRDGMESQLRSLRREVKEYEDLRSGNVKELTCTSLVELPLLLIKARIARGWTHKIFGELCGMPEEQVRHYESTEYAGASLTRLVEIAMVLGIEISLKGVLRKVEFERAGKHLVA